MNCKLKFALGAVALALTAQATAQVTFYEHRAFVAAPSLPAGRSTTSIASDSTIVRPR